MACRKSQVYTRMSSPLLPMNYLQLREHARWLAESHRLIRGKRKDLLLPRLAQNEEILVHSFLIVESAARSKQRMVPAAHWLLDNFYILEEQIWSARHHLPKSYSIELPRLAEGDRRGFPRVYDLIFNLILYSDGLVDASSLENFVAGYQEVSPLQMGELWALPIMLRFSLLETARQTAARIAAGSIDLYNANYWADQIAKISPKNNDAMLQLMAKFVASRPRLSTTFMAELARRLQALYHTPSLPMSWLEQHLASTERNLNGLFLTESQQEAADQVSMGHTVTSLRFVESLDWRKFVEKHSEVHAILCLDPYQAYNTMDFPTRDRYRHVVEAMAKRSSKPESFVAKAAINYSEKSKETYGIKDHRSHVGFYLIDEGKRVLEDSLGLNKNFSWHRLAVWGKFPMYFGAIFAVTLLLGVLLSQKIEIKGSEGWEVYFLLGLCLLLASQMAISLVNWVVNLLVKPIRLTRLDFADQIPTEAATMVVIPTMLSSVSGIDNLLMSLEVYYLGNRDPCLHFALLSDFLDGEQESIPEDDVLLKHAINGIEKLNAKYKATGHAPFHFYHRPRKWNEKQGCWMGWERKRGKLIEFAEFLRGGAASSFSHTIGDPSVLKNIKYIITLDTDTKLPHSTAHQLISAMEHPLNRPVLDEEKGQVVRGYGILQPRVAIDPPSVGRSRYTRLFSGDPGIDPYTREISNVYQDLFGEGSFIGKGIFSVDAFLATLKGRFPENWVLSHDLIESFYARSGLINDVVLYEDFPPSVHTDMSRKHRWVRGDWQISPWLNPWRTHSGNAQTSRLNFLSWWKIFDNLRRSVVSAAFVTVLVLIWLFSAKPMVSTLLVFALMGFPEIIMTLYNLLVKNNKNDWISHLSHVIRDAIIKSVQAFLSLIFLPYEALRNCDAIIRSLFRMIFSKRNLLQWNPSHESERHDKGSLLSYMVSMGWGTGFIAFGWALLLFYRETNAISHFIMFFWFIAPTVAWWVSKPSAAKKDLVSQEDRDYLLQIARDTWIYFEKYCTPEENWLPPDNVQMHPHEIIAHRTSPTNIGLAVLANLSAFDFGFISFEELLKRTEGTLNTLDKLERYNGHFYNWYDTLSLLPLEPHYVSTVDSGNLTACLITVATAFEQMVDDKKLTLTSKSQNYLCQLASRCRELANCDFTFLYNKSRRLLAIGYKVQEHKRDSSYYDLLASEARLASFFAIAMGQLPIEHWYALGRLMNQIGKERVLLSWSGSMFEYLMPMLILPDFDETLLAQSHKAAVRCQIAYGKLRGVPWGISESGYFASDLNHNYQYRAFGVPGLGFKRGLGTDLVIAPYATLMALMVEPKAACANLRRLDAKGFRGECGFYEAIDYTKSRIPPEQNHAVVQSFMAHHQGMGFLGLAHYFLDQPIQKRLLRSPLFQSVVLLLGEGKSKITPFPFYGTEAPQVVPSADPLERSMRLFYQPDPPEPAVQLLTNGHYHVVVGSAGEGYSSLGGTYISRFRPDGLLRSQGVFCYIQDKTNGRVWSNTYQPTKEKSRAFEVIFSEGKAEFKRRDGSVETHTEIVVSPEHNLELRRLRLTNHSRSAVTLDLTSYVEIALSTMSADEAHPAFNKLFVQTEIIKSLGGVICHRRQRTDNDQSPWVYHALFAHKNKITDPSYETDRYRFIGRGRDLQNPIAMTQSLSGTDGCVLDPILSMRQTISLSGYETSTVDLILGMAKDRQHCLDMLASFQDKASSDRLLELAWTNARVILQHLNIEPSTAQLFNRVAGLILYPRPALRTPAVSLMQSHPRGQAGLWGYGISGDLPLVLLRLNRTSQIPLLRELLTAHSYWRQRGLYTDLLIWNEDESSYRQHLHDEIMAASGSFGIIGQNPAEGGIYIIRPDQISEEDRRLLQTVARVVINGQNEASLVNQIMNTEVLIASKARGTDLNPSKPLSEENSATQIASPSKKPFMNAEGNEFVIPVSAGSKTPLPWVNVIANNHFGTVISESGSSYTWYENAQEFRLTPWHNDPVLDPSGEAYYIQDLDSGLFWSPMPWPTPGEGDYTVRHGFGYTVFEHRSQGIVSETWVFVDDEEPIKYILVRLRNESGILRHLSLTGICEWVLGPSRTKTGLHLVTEGSKETIFARNPFLTSGAERTAFFSVAGGTSFTADRRDAIGELGDWKTPAAMYNQDLSGVSGPGYDSCAALRVAVTLENEGGQDIAFILGAGRDQLHARELAKIASSLRPPAKVLRTVRQAWSERLAKVTIETPDAALNGLANGWLLYQTMSSRFWARSGFYQSGGAYGFRDQLQDAMAFVHCEPQIVREHLIRCAEKQFIEGDVLHWWHPPSGRGVRTSFSDDYLWMPLAVAHYVHTTGDYSVLDENISFIEGRLLNLDEESHYDLPHRSEKTASLYEHCVLAINHALPLGVHGLPLMGCGDWNDGMNLVGIKGKGESVWLGFFIFTVLDQFKRLAKHRGDKKTLQLCDQHQGTLAKNLEQNAWDGEWYLRAFFDNGEPLGSKKNTECAIDLLPQAWAAISGAVPVERAKKGMDAVNERLVRREASLIQLFDPPFDKTPHNPGYIKGYPPGIRENGGQYTHAAIWAIWAFARLGDNEKAWELFNLINPMKHSESLESMQRYMVEPYIVAADIYSQPPHVGRGGWTWYTGSAAWMYRLIIEGLFGLRREGDFLGFEPCLNPAWESSSLRYQFKNTRYALKFLKTETGKGIKRIVLDGKEIEAKGIKLIDDGSDHEVLIETL